MNRAASLVESALKTIYIVYKYIDIETININNWFYIKKLLVFCMLPYLKWKCRHSWTISEASRYSHANVFFTHLYNILTIWIILLLFLSLFLLCGLLFDYIGQLLGSKPTPPFVDVEPSYKTVNVGESVDFKCTATGVPSPQIRWIPENNRQFNAQVL